MKKLIFAVVGTMFALLPYASGQTDARLIGTVTDPTGAVVGGAAIKIQNEQTGSERTVKANEQGNYIAAGLTPAPYTVTASGADLGPTEYKSVTLAAGQERTLN